MLILIQEIPLDEQHIYFIPETTAHLTIIATLPVGGMIIHLQELALRTSVLQEMI